MRRWTDFAAVDTMQRYLADMERSEAAALLAAGYAALYCAGPGAPVVTCRTLAEWDRATRSKSPGGRHAHAAC